MAEVTSVRGDAGGPPDQSETRFRPACFAR